jgi:hypothetical protein
MPTEATTRTLVVKGTVATGAHKRVPVSGGYVGLLMPQGPNGGHWIGLGFTSASGLSSTTVIQPDGTYRFTVEVAAVEATEGYPIFVAASDASQTLTMLAELPKDTGVEGADLTIDINPTTTFASEMICPGGVSPPPVNTWCYSDPKAPSVDDAELVALADGALATNLLQLEPGTPPRWATFAAGFLNDPATFAAIKANLTGHGVAFGAATPASIVATLAGAALPLVKPPAPASSSSGGTSSGGGACKLVWNCGASSQCATVYGAKTGSAAQPDAATCQTNCKAQGACTCQGC